MATYKRRNYEMQYNADLFVKHLSEMVQIPTISCVNPDDMDMDAYFALHKYLEETYPLVHQKMTREVIGRCGLLYHWKGNGKSDKLPLMLTAHQDVVPEGDHSMWIHPPFSGEVADGYVWGRGTTDSKCNIQGYMDALELLIADGFEPEYDLYFAFGYNEEIMGGPEPAAELIANVLRERGVVLGCLLDECGGLQHTPDGRMYAFIYTSEKGYADFEFSKRHPGGHSALPPEHTALGSVCNAACILEANPLDVILTEGAIEQMEGMAPFMDDEKLAELCKDVKGNWEELRPILEKIPGYNAIIRTTTAVTMGQGSAQANVLPEFARIVVNNRILPGQSLDDLWEHYRKIIPEDIDVRLLKGTNPPAAQSTKTEAYKLIESIIEEKYPGTPMVPSMLFGGTDSRYYTDLCPTMSVYRFTGLRWKEPAYATSHKVNERIDCDILEDNVDFYVKLFSRYGK